MDRRLYCASCLHFRTSTPGEPELGRAREKTVTGLSWLHPVLLLPRPIWSPFVAVRARDCYEVRVVQNQLDRPDYYARSRAWLNGSGFRLAKKRSGMSHASPVPADPHQRFAPPGVGRESEPARLPAREV